MISEWTRSAKKALVTSPSESLRFLIDNNMQILLLSSLILARVAVRMLWIVDSIPERIFFSVFGCVSPESV